MALSIVRETRLRTACPLNLRHLAMELLVVWAGATSAFVSGLTGSMHCALMCGPLACATLPRTHGRHQAMLAWHAGRVLSYGLVGFILGLFGRGLSQTLMVSVQPVLPWVMAIGLVVTSLDLAKHVGPIPGLAFASKVLVRAGAGLSPTARTLVWGAITPLLPCGLLYGLFLAAMATGSPWGGASVLACFALGAIPALTAVQLSEQRIGWSPQLSAWLRTVVPLVAAALLVARALVHRSATTQCG